MFGSRNLRTIHRWDIVQIRQGDRPGRFDLWLSVKGELHLVPLRIPREFYVHLRTPREDQFETNEYSAQKITRTLPHDRPCLNLYRLSVREELYIESQEHFVNLTNEPNVDGVYELQVRPFQY